MSEEKKEKGILIMKWGKNTSSKKYFIIASAVSRGFMATSMPAKGSETGQRAHGCRCGTSELALSQIMPDTAQRTPQAVYLSQA